jgi:hypothetical protein
MEFQVGATEEYEKLEAIQQIVKRDNNQAKYNEKIN